MPLLWSQQPAPPPAAAEAPLEPVVSSITVAGKVTAESPAAIAVLDGLELARIPGVNLDDRLRMVPGFSLFRRNSSLVAHPTTQGISLRGIGSSGASRALVLWDGMPINDPFGGWVYWTRVAPEELGRVEISRGASTSLFGDRAMGGAIGLFSREPEPRRITAFYEFGNRNTNVLGGGASHLWRERVALSGHTRAFTTNGYFLVPERARGAVDREANVRFVASAARLDLLGASQRFFFKADTLVEERGNGTPIQRNSTSFGNVGVNYARQFSRDSISAVAFHSRGEFRSGFSTILAGRVRETLSSRQTVPSDAWGGSGYWRHSASNWNLLGGTDLWRVAGQSIDRFPTITRIGEGTQFQHGRFFQADATAGPVRFFLGARHHVPGARRQFFSPSAGVTAGKGAWRGRFTAYRSLRAPTLNELYRDFRQGNAVTQANAQLKPESIFGMETGLDWSGESTRIGMTAFRNDLRDIVTNLTLPSPPAEIMRQRRNAAQALARGAEIEIRQRWREFSGEASYLFVDTRFSSGPRTPQVPKHQGSLQGNWQPGATALSFGVRASAAQFEDDLNRFVLPGYAVAQFSAKRQLWRGLAAQVVLENLLDREFVVGFSPTPLVGAPRLWRAGLRWDGRI
ncbi:MAG: TonB-dependent receptor [Acidobacteria bacterium]|nr:TonB-dependent receptor [Acidobacteriota bacterium]